MPCSSSPVSGSGFRCYRRLAVYRGKKLACPIHESLIGIEILPGIQCVVCIGVLISRVNSIVRLVIFACCRHGSDFGFGAGKRAFLPRVANRAQDQSAKNDDDADDDD